MLRSGRRRVRKQTLPSPAGVGSCGMKAPLSPFRCPLALAPSLRPSHSPYCWHCLPTGSGVGNRETACAPAPAREQHMAQPQQSSVRNRLLKALSPADFALLQPHLEPIQLTLREMVAEADAPLRDAAFVETGVLSLLASSPEDRI